MQRLFALTFILAIAGSPVLTRAADKPKPADKPNPTGTWKWEVNFNGQTFDLTLKLKIDGDKLSGTMIGPNDQETAIEDAKFADDKVSFSVVREINGNKTTRKYTGKLSGDTIKGKSESERDGQTTSRDWEAKRETAKAPAGTWKWTVEFGGQSHDMVLELKYEGDKLTGTLTRDDQKSDIKDAKFADGKLTFTVERDLNGQTMTFKYTGKVTGDALEGESTIDRDGQTTSREWKAKKG